jgi:hypothetical protein
LATTRFQQALGGKAIKHHLQQLPDCIARHQPRAKLTQYRIMEASVSQFQSQRIFPIKPNKIRVLLTKTGSERHATLAGLAIPNTAALSVFPVSFKQTTKPGV